MLDPIFLGDHAQLSVEAPIGGATCAALFIPGASGGAFETRFEPLVHTLNSRGIACSRLSLYTSTEERDQRSMNEMHGDIHAAVAALREKGFATLYAIGKSFGGALLLTYPGEAFKARVLWAPAISTAASAPNFNSFKDMALGNVPPLSEVTIDRDFLSHLSGSASPTLILHGTEDEIMPLENSQTLAWMLPQAELKTIEGADHSYKSPTHEHIVLQDTLDFLQSQS